MADAEAIKTAIIQVATEAAKVIMLMMIEANEISRKPITGATKANSNIFIY